MSKQVIKFTPQEMHFLAESIKLTLIKKRVFTESITLNKVLSMPDNKIIESWFNEGPFQKAAEYAVQKGFKNAEVMGTAKGMLKDVYSKGVGALNTAKEKGYNLKSIRKPEDLDRVRYWLPIFKRDALEMKARGDTWSYNEHLKYINKFSKLIALGEEKLQVMEKATKEVSDTLASQMRWATARITGTTAAATVGLEALNNANKSINQGDFAGAKVQLKQVSTAVPANQIPGISPDAPVANKLIIACLGIIYTAGSIMVIRLVWPLLVRLCAAAKTWYQGSNLKSMITYVINLLKKVTGGTKNSPAPVQA